MKGFKKITPVNGFDAANLNNAMQNNYAWAMEEMGDYLYVGTGRNILYNALLFLGAEVPELLRPDPVDNHGEIWRYKKDGSLGWQRVYTTPPEQGNIGFRFMIRYTTPGGETALYAGTLSLTPGIILVKSTDGINWRTLDTPIEGTSTRTMTIHNGRLYMGVLTGAITGEFLLYESADPEGEGWRLIRFAGDPDRNPRGGIDTMTSFNGQLYLGTAPPGGLEVWRTINGEPAMDEWKLVVDQGAGDALNEVPFILAPFNDKLYLGTGIALAVSSTDPEKEIVPPKGGDVIEIGPDDQWRVVVGGEPIAPTNPTTGTRNVSKYPSGFGDIANAYIWNMQAFNGRLYLGTFNWSVLVPPLGLSLLTINRELLQRLFAFVLDPAQWNRFSEQYNLRAWLQSLLQSVPTWPLTMGFDLYVTEDGETWMPVSRTGLGNPRNYGLRTFLASEDDVLYLGTANPFQGCEVWTKEDIK